ncbi:MAG: ribosome-associated translation inhibitor RaiA [Chloroflexi bacterium]|nr:ribosome-associated translation inhibitor RaiA [Chloroflexota bacterium]
MKTTLTARHLDLTTTLRSDIERKLRRLDRVAHPDAEARVELIGNASHSADESHVAEVTLVSSGTVVRSTSPGPTPLAAVDAVLDKLERQMVRSKKRPRRVRERTPGDMGAVATGAATGEVRDRERREPAAPSIVKTKRFDLTPMFEEDAIAQMDDLGHSFFVFLNAETDRLAVVYRRRGGNHGLIDPVVDRRGGRR